jgi:hypothetical protein
VDDDVQPVERLLVEELKEADRAARTVAPVAAIVPAAGEADGIGAVDVGLLGEEEERVLTRAGEDARHEERQPAGGEDRHRGEAASETLAYPEQAEAMAPVPGDGFDPPRPGGIGVAGGGRLVPAQPDGRGRWW